jgi:hypothetical protein
MKALLRDAGHLVRVALVFLAGLVLFLAVRGVLVPKSFGQYGHYRGDSLKEIAARPIKYAGREACADCHPDVAEVKSKGKHARLGCEACHGPLANHAAASSAVKPALPDTAVLCVRCHEVNASKPAKFPQVNSKEHSSGMACGSCHQPHTPAMDSGGTK